MITADPSFDYAKASRERFKDYKLPTVFQQFMHKAHYARWLYPDKRRENWRETAGRYCLFFEKRFPGIFPTEEAYEYIATLKSMPSMRALWTAGPALDRDEISAFNCSFTAINDPKKFDEIMYVLSCGTGVGFSVEKKHVNKLPVVPFYMRRNKEVIVVEDSKDGWQMAYRRLIQCLYRGQIPTWDTSQVRPKGAILKTFGGRASGPIPLEELFYFTKKIFRRAHGRRLTTLECHDIVCKVARSIVSGGVRRSALISISDLDDQLMRTAKPQNFWLANPQRGLANNSAVYDNTPTEEDFDKEWAALVASRTGERGFFNRGGMVAMLQQLGRRDVAILVEEGGLNPCGEIFLRPDGLCNLTEAVVRAGDTLDQLKEKVRVAAILGTFQATLSNYRDNIDPNWKKNQEEERLLGVSLTGILDHEVLQQATEETAVWLRELNAVVVATNVIWAAKLGIRPAAAATCVKPSGTVSQLVDSASGAHTRHNDYYIRHKVIAKTDPLAKFFRAKGYPIKDDYYEPAISDVIAFPVKAPEGAVLRHHRSAIEQLEHYLIIRENWCDHNPSMTVYVQDHEWGDSQTPGTVGHWMYKHFEKVGGVSFLPSDNSSYKQLPFEDCDESHYGVCNEAFPDDIDWDEMAAFESEDMTSGAQELACVGGMCTL